MAAIAAAAAAEEDKEEEEEEEEEEDDEGDYVPELGPLRNFARPPLPMRDAKARTHARAAFMEATKDAQNTEE